MRYEVRLIDYMKGEDTEFPPILETTDRHKAFEFMGEVKKEENKEPYCEYDEVRVYENGVWIAKTRLY